MPKPAATKPTMLTAYSATGIQSPPINGAIDPRIGSTA
jgi:hypothetical protein